MTLSNNVTVTSWFVAESPFDTNLAGAAVAPLATDAANVADADATDAPDPDNYGGVSLLKCKYFFEF